MLRLSFIFSLVHFALSCGLRFGFRFAEQCDSEFAQGCSRFAEKIAFVLTQPGQWVSGFFGCADGGIGFWVLMILTSILWGNIIAFLIRRVFAAIFR